MSGGGNSFNQAKSPKIAQGGLKQMKLTNMAGVQGGKSGTYHINQSSINGAIYGQKQSHGKNVRIVLVGNNGTKGSHFASGSQGLGAIQTGLPKTTKNVSKYYTQSGQREDLMNANYLASSKNKAANSFRNDGFSSGLN